MNSKVCRSDTADVIGADLDGTKVVDDVADSIVRASIRRMAKAKSSGKSRRIVFGLREDAHECCGINDVDYAENDRMKNISGDRLNVLDGGKVFPLNERVIREIEASTYRWRTASGIAKSLGVTKDDVDGALDRLENVVIVAGVPSKGGEALYTTKSKYLESTPVMKRVFNILLNSAE